ncbi:hypothetical protein, partial [Streptococcus uberis]
MNELLSSVSPVFGNDALDALNDADSDPLVLADVDVLVEADSEALVLAEVDALNDADSDPLV